MIDLSRLIEQANELAPFPASTVRLARMAANPECNLSDFAEIIAYDPVLTLKLLRAANRVANATATRVTTVQEAVSRMGTSRLVALAVASGARPYLCQDVPAYGLDEGALWRHSVAAANVAECAPKFCTTRLPSEAFTAALLHDIGKLVMGRFLSADILHFITAAREVDHLSRREAESLILGVHHGELGGLIAQQWELPARVVQGIIYQHDPGAGNDAVCDFTYLSNEVAKRIDAQLAGKTQAFRILPEVAQRLGTTDRQIDQLFPIAAARFSEVSLRYNAV